MAHPFFDDTLFIDVTFAARLAVGVSASIHRIGQDVVECGVSGRDPADRTRLSTWISRGSWTTSIMSC
jgi:hypothetical protein